MKFASPDPDLALVRACQNPAHDGFDAAFEELYTRYHDRVYSIAYRMMGTTSDALDIVQEAFSVLFRKIGSFRSDAKFSTWFFRLVVNCCVDAKRRQSSRSSTQLTPVEDLVQAPGNAIDPGAAAEATELGDHVHEGLQRLSPKLRAVLVLRYLEGLSYDELAASLDISLGTVKSRLARAHIAFQSVLSGSLESFDYPFGARRRDDGAEGVA